MLELNHIAAHSLDVGNVSFPAWGMVDYLLPRLRKLRFPISMPRSLWLMPRIAFAIPDVCPMLNSNLAALWYDWGAAAWADSGQSWLSFNALCVIEGKSHGVRLVRPLLSPCG